MKIFPDATYDDLASFSPDGFFLVKWLGDPEPLLGAILAARFHISRYLNLFRSSSN
jgi:carbamoyl-phosphate synthase small subunit